MEKANYSRELIGNSVVPIKVYMLFATSARDSFTVTEAIEILQEKYKITISYNRANQILNELVTAQMLEKNLIPSGSRRKQIAHYSFKHGQRTGND